MIRLGHSRSCARLHGEAFCSCGDVDVVELVDWFVDRATGKVLRAAA